MSQFLHSSKSQMVRFERRNQPHAAQDAGGHARSDAGAAGQRRRHDAPAARAVLRAGHAEPAGTGRHLPAARSPARPLPAVHQGRLSQRRRGMGDRPPRDHRPAWATSSLHDAATRSSSCRSWSPACRSAIRCSATPGPWSARRRPGTPEAPDFVNQWVNWGAGPRGVLTLVTCAKARAILYGRYHATVGDVQAVVKPALRHRIAGNYAAQANNVGQRTADRHADGSDPGRQEVREAGRVTVGLGSDSWNFEQLSWVLYCKWDTTEIREDAECVRKIEKPLSVPSLSPWCPTATRRLQMVGRRKVFAW